LFDAKEPSQKNMAWWLDAGELKMFFGQNGNRFRRILKPDSSAQK